MVAVLAYDITPILAKRREERMRREREIRRVSEKDKGGRTTDKARPTAYTCRWPPTYRAFLLCVDAADASCAMKSNLHTKARGR